MSYPGMGKEANMHTRLAAEKPPGVSARTLSPREQSQRGGQVSGRGVTWAGILAEEVLVNRARGSGGDRQGDLARVDGCGCQVVGAMDR